MYKEEEKYIKYGFISNSFKNNYILFISKLKHRTVDCRNQLLKRQVFKKHSLWADELEKDAPLTDCSTKGSSLVNRAWARFQALTVPCPNNSGYYTNCRLIYGGLY